MARQAADTHVPARDRRGNKSDQIMTILVTLMIEVENFREIAITNARAANVYRRSGWYSAAMITAIAAPRLLQPRPADLSLSP
jgi:hypothetical protein